VKKIVVGILATVGGIVVVVLIGSLIVVAVRGKGPVRKKTVLELNLENGMTEYVPDDPVAEAMLRDKVRVRDVVEALERAGNDDRVAGMVARFGGSTLGMAQAQEVRDAVTKFRSKGKFAVAFAETFGEVGPGTNSYYVATAFDKIYLQPSGDVGLTGIMMQGQFVKGTLEKLGMKFHGDHRYEYKNALNMLTETKFTPPHKEAMQKVLDSWYGQVVKGIAEGRHLSEDQVKATIDKGPYLGKEAQDAKLVDGLMYRDEVYDKVKKQGGNAELLYLSQYLERAGRPHEHGKTIALIYGAGGVQRGKSGYDPIFGEASMGSDTVAGAFRAAIDDKHVKAILFRVDSPGGSYVASDAIWREVGRARRAGKPVIVSMGDVAGSGGYFVAMQADKIVAQPGTITASIGVLGGKMLTKGLWDKVGLSWDEVHDGANARIFDGTWDYSPQEWARFEAWLDRVYVDFTGKVAEGRKLPKERVLEIAKGRIWSGEDAKQLGLVDELGGFPVALALAKKAANIPESEEVKLKEFPQKKTLLQRLMAGEPENSEKQASTDLLVHTLQIIQPVMKQMHVAMPGARDELRVPEGVPVN
jgi:protease-4